MAADQDLHHGALILIPRAGTPLQLPALGTPPPAQGKTRL